MWKTVRYGITAVDHNPSLPGCNIDDVCLCVYPVDDGPVFAMCMTSQGDQATLNQWISGLQQSNPILGQIPTLFRLGAGPRELQGVGDTDSASGTWFSSHTHKEEADPGEDAEAVVEEEPRRSQGVKQWTGKKFPPDSLRTSREAFVNSF